MYSLVMSPILFAILIAPCVADQRIDAAHTWWTKASAASFSRARACRSRPGASITTTTRIGAAARRITGTRNGPRSRAISTDEEAGGQRRPHPPASRQIHGRRRISPNEKRSTVWASFSSLAEKERLYLDLTGLGCYHKKDVPAWYDKLSEKDRWARAGPLLGSGGKAMCAHSPAVFCYDLMNEPVVPGGKRKPGDWLAGAVRGQALRPVHHTRPGRAVPARHRPPVDQDT